LNQLLVEMDGFSDNSGVMVIAATNREDVLDPALLRAGRFDRQITVNLPDRIGRAAIFRVHARNKKIDPSIDFDGLARRTVGFFGRHRNTSSTKRPFWPCAAIREQVAIDRHRRRPRPSQSPDRRKRAGPLNEHERRASAYHEAGHAIIGLN
jgi:cell division protease FtsH